MSSNFENSVKYKTIGQVAKELNLINKKNGTLQTHTLRYWESQFRQLKPSLKAGKRRYYTEKDLKIIKIIKHLLKVEGLTINGVRKILDNKINQSIDQRATMGVYKPTLKSSTIIKKIKNISKIVKELKKIK